MKDRPDMKKLTKDVRKAFEKHGIDDPALIISFTSENTGGYDQVHWVSTISRNDSIKMLVHLANKIKAQLN